MIKIFYTVFDVIDLGSDEERAAVRTANLRSTLKHDVYERGPEVITTYM